MQPDTKYAWLGRDRIAYQVLGQGPPDLVVSFGTFSHVDIAWEDPGLDLFLRMLASFSRLILFDRCGTGASDPVVLDALPPWERYVEELDAVLDQVGSERAAIMAHVDGGAMALLFAAGRPERTSALVLVNCSARWVAAEDYPIGIPLEVAEGIRTQIDQLWGTDALVGTWAASRAGDERFRRWATKYQRAMASPRTIQAFTSTFLELDSRPILPLVQAPTLVLAKQGFQLVPIEQSRYLAEHIPHAKLVELPGTDALLAWETPERALDLIEQFLAGARRSTEATRVLQTVLFTDIVGSTQRARQLGDRRWRQVLTVHDELASRVIEEFRGRLVETTGDGILATFDGPGRAIRCAAALRDELAGIGLHIRVGLHTGEIELRESGVGGIAVHIAARVMATAKPAEIRTSRTVRDLVVGSDIAMEDLGTHSLKGVEGAWQLFAAKP
ncbi:MAG: adenylate/guanylate cyclase domain-containing protein [Jiangellaceae bacterium]|nr:adenylate/guanylate cyclase domain-containing protein [Jiangellaceae bacterium]